MFERLRSLFSERKPDDQEECESLQEVLPRLAKLGNVEAQATLAGKYFFGLDGFPQDLQESFKWAKLSAEKGNSEGMYLMGQFYLEGVQVQFDPKESDRWFRASAELGNEEGQCMLGTSLLVPPEEQYMWLLLAASSDVANTIRFTHDNLEALRPYLSQTQIREAEESAATWRRSHKLAGE